MSTRWIYLIPGQGGNPSGALRRLYGVGTDTAAIVDRVLADIEQAAHGNADGLRDVLLGDPETVLTGSGLPQLAGYAVSVVLAEVLTSVGIRPAGVIGQSFGEIAALVCAGSLDISGGTRAVCALNAAFRGFEGQGGMVLVSAGEAATLRLLTEVDRADLVLACVNTPAQTIVSGPITAIEALFAAAGDRIRLIRLAVPYASHHPSLTEVADRFRAGLRTVPWRSPRVRVHSPVRRRAYTETDDLSEALADCVVKPVYLPETLARVAESRQVRFVELGVGDMLCRCAKATLPGITTLAPLAGDLSWLTPRAELPDTPREFTTEAAK